MKALTEKHTTALAHTHTGVDIAKLFFAFCIVILHSDILYSLPNGLSFFGEKLVIRLAVPYFFVASGFFLGKKALNAEGDGVFTAVKGYCLRLLYPLLIFEAIATIIAAIKQFNGGMAVADIIYEAIRYALFYPHGALWFVQACIVGALLLFPFLQRKKIRSALLLGSGLYAFALIANNYYFLIEGSALAPFIDGYLDICISPRNGLFVGFVYLAIGVLCCKLREQHKFKRRNLAGCTLCLFFVYVTEVVLLRNLGCAWVDDGALYISQLVLIPCLFLLTLETSLPISTKHSVLCRNLSTGIFFLHRPLLQIFGYVIPSTAVNLAATLVTAVVICIIAYRTDNRYLCRLLK